MGRKLKIYLDTSVINFLFANDVPELKKITKEFFDKYVKNNIYIVYISDIVIKGVLHPELKKSAEMYAGCVAGAVQLEEYLNIIEQAGFVNVEIKKTKMIELPDEVLLKYLNNKQLKEFKENQVGIFSITVVGYRN